VPSPVLALGVLGAVLRGLYWLQYQVSRRIFRAQFVVAQLAAPWIGLLLGVASYLVIRGGLFTLEASSGHAADITEDHSLLVRVVAFVAGFQWEPFLELLIGIFAKIRSSGAASSAAESAD
jgi:hypothetical protein